MFPTRAGLVVDCTFLVTLLAPLVAFASLRLARGGRHHAHRKLQIGLLCVCALAVLALEARIRVAGGSGAFIGQSSVPQYVVRTVLGVHVTGAIATYVAWGWLAVASNRRFGARLPGSFSRRHRRIGSLVFAGLCFTALSAAAMYTLAFVL